MKLVLIEDDASIATEIRKALMHEGFNVLCAPNGQRGLVSVNEFMPDMVILDLGLPDQDGVNVLKQLRQKQMDLPVLILTARDSLESKIHTLDRGADDYLVKPFAMPELLARLRVLARRISTANSSEICIAGVTLDLVANQVRIDKQVLNLSRREYAILKTLIENAGRIQSKQKLETQLYDGDAEIASNTIEAHISNLRKKLPENFIRTIRGVGYTVDKQGS